jgi:lipopolysaccharide/colanic/teichoic acid biosynthesis glycosyltransferase
MSGKILIVEDSQPAAQMIGMVLSAAQYETKIVYDGLNAIRVTKAWKPDLVLLDVMMPNMDGFEICRRLRLLDEGGNLPIILLTAKKSVEDKIVGFEAGADDYITKPFDNAELKMRVAARLRRVQQANVQSDLPIPGWTTTVPLAIERRDSGLFHRGYRVTKRLFDFAVSILSAPFVLLLLMVIAVAIRLDSPGPIVFAQVRAGRNGRPFKMYKFRTMVRNAEELKVKYAHLNELTWPDFKITNDPRVTRVGRLLRKTSLDELPQMLNVIKGDMSLVGPRPTSFAADTYQLWQTERLEVLPGLTGLWQVKGRSDIDFKERVELDIEYIERQSWRLDLEIIAQTISAVVTGRGAH